MGLLSVNIFQLFMIFTDKSDNLSPSLFTEKMNVFHFHQTKYSVLNFLITLNYIRTFYDRSTRIILIQGSSDA